MMLSSAMFPGILPGAEDPSHRPATARTCKAPRGRPRVSDDPAMRRKHITVAIHRLKFGNTLDQVCNRFDISPRTVQLWLKRVRTYPEAAALFPAR
jgi:Helix-turn-helix domain